MDIVEAYDVVDELARSIHDTDLYWLLSELHYWRNVEIVGGEEELAAYYEDMI